MKVFDGICATLLMGAMIGCSTESRQGVLHGLPLPPTLSAQADHYAIRSGDLLTISFAGEPDLTQQVRVDWNGTISMPILAAEGTGEVRAAGLSASAVAERVSELAKNNKMLVNARAQVLVYEPASQAFTVLGQVTQPGRYSFPRGVPPQLPLEEAIALAGGATRLAKLSDILVKRGNAVYQVDLKKLVSETGQPPAIILPGDIITVNERRF